MDTLHLSTDAVLAVLVGIISYLFKQKLTRYDEQLKKAENQAVDHAKLEGRFNQLDTKVDGIAELVELKIDNLNDTLKVFMQAKGRP